MLFDPKQVSDELFDPEFVEGKSIITSDEEDFAFGKSNSKIEDVFVNFDLSKTTHYVSAGQWSMIELTEFIISKIGPAHLLVATWSMSQESAVKLIGLLEKRQILSLMGVLDFRTKNRHPDAFQLANTIFSKLHLGSCHAKVSVLRNENFDISISSSANYTNNPRIEAGVISATKSVADFHASWIYQLLNSSKPFE